jgi:hypothetical protein
MGGRDVVLARLRDIRGDFLCARVITLQLRLSNAHAARGHQLVDKIAAALTVLGQLIESEAR